MSSWAYPENKFGDLVCKSCGTTHDYRAERCSNCYEAPYGSDFDGEIFNIITNLTHANFLLKDELAATKTLLEHLQKENRDLWYFIKTTIPAGPYHD